MLVIVITVAANIETLNFLISCQNLIYKLPQLVFMANKNQYLAALVVTALFFSGTILIPALQQKVYASPPPPSVNPKFDLTVKHVFKSNSKVEIKFGDDNEKVIVPGHSGTKHVTLDLGRQYIRINEPYTLCLSAPHHGKECTQEYFTQYKSEKRLCCTWWISELPIQHKTVFMNILRH